MLPQKVFYNSLLDSLQSYGMMENYLKTYLVCVVCDGTAVTLGNKSGITKLMDTFPFLIVWHCADHRLELLVGDTVKWVAGVSRFKMFIDKLNVLFNASLNNCRELKLCANLLEIQVLI